MHTAHGTWAGRLTLALVVFLGATNRYVVAASFNCQRTGLTQVEKLICQTPSLSTADEAMATLYTQATSSPGDNIQVAQKQWLRERNRCTEVLCLYGIYETRIQALRSQVAGGTPAQQAAVHALTLLGQDIANTPTPAKVDMPPAREPPVTPPLATRFDCRTAKTPLQKALCTHAALLQMHNELLGLYDTTVSLNIEEAASYRLWWTNVNRRCTDADCLRPASIRELYRPRFILLREAIAKVPTPAKVVTPPADATPVSQPKTARFDCRTPKNALEKLLCTNPALLQLHDEMTEAYLAALKGQTDATGRSALIAAQKNWWTHMEACTRPACARDLPASYRHRLGVLRALGMQGEKGETAQSPPREPSAPQPLLRTQGPPLASAPPKMVQPPPNVAEILADMEAGRSPNQAPWDERFVGGGDHLQATCPPFSQAFSTGRYNGPGCYRYAAKQWIIDRKDPPSFEQEKQECARRGKTFAFGACLANVYAQELLCEAQGLVYWDTTCREASALQQVLRSETKKHACEEQGLFYNFGVCVSPGDRGLDPDKHKREIASCEAQEAAFFSGQCMTAAQMMDRLCAERGLVHQDGACLGRADTTAFYAKIFCEAEGGRRYLDGACQSRADQQRAARVAAEHQEAEQRTACKQEEAEAMRKAIHPPVHLVTSWWSQLVSIPLGVLVFAWTAWRTRQTLRWPPHPFRAFLKVVLLAAFFVLWGGGVYGYGAQFVNKTYNVNAAKYKAVQATWPTVASFLTAPCITLLGYDRRQPEASADARRTTAEGEYQRFLIGWQVNIWAFVAVLVLGVAWMNPWRWGIGWRFFLIPLAAGLMAGDFLFEWILTWALFVIGVLVHGAAGLFGMSLVLPWWGWWVLFLAMPFMVMFLLLYLLVQPFTLTFVEMAALLIGVPVFLANQFLHMDQVLQRYRAGRAGMVGRIQRFRDWLYGTPQPVVPDERHGARFATTDEAQARNAPHDTRSMAFGHLPNERGL